MKTLLLVPCLVCMATAAPPEPKFHAQDLDAGIQIGYGLAIADVDGDGKPDVLLADKKQFVWYRNPGKRDVAWNKFVLAENLTTNDNVCIAALDIDDDGKCEIAVGAEWNPGDTVNSGAVFYLIAPADRTQKWEAVKFPAVEPTTHRMKWMQTDEKGWGLVVVPLHGRANKGGAGAGVKVLLYRKPDDPRTEWKPELLDDSLHATHNFEIVPELTTSGLILGGKEGLRVIGIEDRKWQSKMVKTLDGPLGSPGIGEVRCGRVGNQQVVAAIEPMHGNTLSVYLHDETKDTPGIVRRHVITDRLIEGHALACADLVGMSSDQIVVGWRGNATQPKSVGIHLWTPLDATGEKWRESAVDDGGMACEDLAIADLDGDRKLDIIASGRSTKNVKIYWNDR